MSEVTWNEAICVHAGKCVKGLPEVFKVEDGKFKIDKNGATEEKIRQQIAECPSGALRMSD